MAPNSTPGYWVEGYIKLIEGLALTKACQSPKSLAAFVVQSLFTTLIVGDLLELGIVMHILSTNSGIYDY